MITLNTSSILAHWMSQWLNTLHTRVEQVNSMASVQILGAPRSLIAIFKEFCGVTLK